MPPITAAIRTPKAPTPPRSSAAGGLEKLVDPDGRELLDVPLVVDDGRLEDALEDVVLPGLLAVVEEVDFVSVGLPAADALPVDELADEPVAVDGRLEP